MALIACDDVVGGATRDGRNLFQMLRSRFSTCVSAGPLRLYCEALVRRPCAVIIWWALVCMLIFAMRVSIPTVELSGKSDDVLGDGPLNRMYTAAKDSTKAGDEQWPSWAAIVSGVSELPANSTAAIDVAEKEARRQNTSNVVTTAAPEPWTFQRKVEFIYVARDGDILSKKAWADVEDFESRLLGCECWKSVCAMMGNNTPGNLCDGGISLRAYLMPSLLRKDEHSFTYVFDGRGQHRLDTTGVVAWLKEALDGHAYSHIFPNSLKLFWKLEKPSPTPPVIRSTFIFATQEDVYSGEGNPDKQFNQILKPHIHSVFLDHSENYEHIYVYTRDKELLEIINMKFMIECMPLFMIMGAGILFYVIIGTRSVCLGAVTILLLILSMPFAFALTGLADFSLLCLASPFFILGIGADIVFVFVSFYTQSKEHTSVPAEQLAYTIKHAGAACWATSATTAVGLAASVVSPMRQLREFVFYMAVSVLVCFGFAMFFLPSVVVLMYERRRRRDAPGTSMTSIVPSSKISDGHGYEDMGEKCSDAKPPKGHRRSCTDFGIRMILMFPCSIVSITGLSAVGFCLGLVSIMPLEQDTSVPKNFPDDHNQVAAFEWAYTFDDSEFPVYPHVDVCSGNMNWSDALCRIRICERYQDVESSGSNNFANSSRSCWWSGQRNSGCANVSMRVHLIASIDAYRSTSHPLPLDLTGWKQGLRDALHAATQLPNVNASISNLVEPQTFVIMEDWESGDSTFGKSYDLGYITAATLETDFDPSNVCEMTAVCFEGPTTCAMPDGWQLLEMSSATFTPTASPTSEPTCSPTSEPTPSPTIQRVGSSNDNRESRGVNPFVVDPNVVTHLVWGILPATSTPMFGAMMDPTFSWDATFAPEDPWAQRAIYAMCAVTAFPEHLLVGRVHCEWLEAFRTWLYMQNSRFPSRSFNPQLSAFVGLQGKFKEDIVVQEGYVKSLRITIVGLADGLGLDKKIVYSKQLAEFLDQWGSTAPTTANRPLPVPEKSTVMDETMTSGLQAVAETVIIALVIACVAVFIFTFDIRSVFLSLFVFIWSILGCAFVLFVVRGLPLGLIEVVAIIFFIGYAVTFSMHVVHAYAEAKPNVLQPEQNNEETSCDGDGTKRDLEDLDQKANSCYIKPRRIREARVHAALSSIGLATMNSAMTTFVTTWITMLSAMVVVTKMAFTLFLVTFFSAVGALVVLPACLTLMGSLTACDLHCLDKRLKPLVKFSSPAKKEPADLFNEMRQQECENERQPYARGLICDD